jgi:hypothetical protein
MGVLRQSVNIDEDPRWGRAYVRCTACTWHGKGRDSISCTDDLARCPECRQPVEWETLGGLPLVEPPLGTLPEQVAYAGSDADPGYVVSVGMPDPRNEVPPMSGAEIRALRQARRSPPGTEREP